MPLQWKEKSFERHSTANSVRPSLSMHHKKQAIAGLKKYSSNVVPYALANCSKFERYVAGIGAVRSCRDYLCICTRCSRRLDAVRGRRREHIRDRRASALTQRMDALANDRQFEYRDRLDARWRERYCLLAHGTW